MQWSVLVGSRLISLGSAQESTSASYGVVAQMLFLEARAAGARGEGSQQGGKERGTAKVGGWAAEVGRGGRGLRPLLLVSRCGCVGQWASRVGPTAFCPPYDQTGPVVWTISTLPASIWTLFWPSSPLLAPVAYKHTVYAYAYVVLLFVFREGSMSTCAVLVLCCRGTDGRCEPLKIQCTL